MVAHLPLTNLFYLITFYLHDTTIVSEQFRLKDGYTERLCLTDDDRLWISEFPDSKVSMISSSEVSIKTVCYALGKCAYSGITVI